MRCSKCRSCIGRPPARIDALISRYSSKRRSAFRSRFQYNRLSSFIFLLFFYLIQIDTADSSIIYDVDVVELAKIPYSYATTTFVKNETLYSYGGVTRTSDASQNFASIRLDFATGEISYESVVQVGNIKPYAAYSQGVLLPDGNRFVLFGAGQSEADVLSWDGALRVYLYRFDTMEWEHLNVTASSLLPVHRGQFTADLSPNGKIYLYGGQTPGGKLSLGDAWVYDPETLSFSLIPPMQGLNMSLFGHLSIMLPTGTIVYLMGTGYLNGVLYDNNVNGTMCDMALLFDTYSHQWKYQPLGGNEEDIPQQIINGYAALGPDQQTVYLSGGFGASRMLRQQSVSSNDMSVLSTVTWKWLPNGNIKGSTPRPRFFASAERLSDTVIAVAFGTSEYFWYNDINLLEFSTLSDGTEIGIWRTNISAPLPEPVSEKTETLSLEQKTGIAIGSFIVFVAFTLFASWYFRESVRQFINRSYRGVVWTIRVGEPLWTGISHIVSKITLTFLFMAYLVFIVKSVIDSGQTVVEITEPVNWVLLPDIRFCFDGYTNTAVGCETESLSIDDCVQLNFTQRLNLTQHAPYFDYSGEIECHLFHADETFNLAASGNFNQSTRRYFGSRIQFSLFGTPANLNQVEKDERFVHVAVYPRNRDPNRDFFLNEGKYMSSAILENWLMDDSNNLATSIDHRMTLSANTSATLSYQLIRHQSLQSSVWNNVGIAPAYIDTDEVEATFSPGVKRYLRPGNRPGSVNFLDVYPEGFVLKKRLEQKLSTFLSSVGSVGGLLSLFVTLNSWLFGARPRSPWGIVHRVLWGNLSKNWLLNGLRAKFGGISANVPFVHPVESALLTDDQADYFGIDLNHRVSDRKQKNLASSVNVINRRDTLITQFSARTRCEDGNDVVSEDPRIAVLVDQVELLHRRIQMTELVLKEYYIDDEVFRNISAAMNIAEGNPDYATLSPSDYRIGALTTTSAAEDDGIMKQIRKPLARHLSIQSASMNSHDLQEQKAIRSSSSLPLPETLVHSPDVLSKNIQ
ncbi:hypothetical protein BX666DRAFT_1995218 [Dichotomocladium elegans]|nr:hypothetical protein BX666DRAFT_1995218 [Dichotomocladium elegans]